MTKSIIVNTTFIDDIAMHNLLNFI